MFRIGLFLALGLASMAASAQSDTTDAADVWRTVEAQWKADASGDEKWFDRMLTDRFMGWSKTAPAPRSKDSTEMWSRFNRKRTKLVAHELYPLSIVVEGDVAVAHYLYSSATENSKDDVDVTNGRFTDGLIRTDDGWRFLSWHGGDD